MKPENRPPFNVSATATIKHLNVRKEGAEDDKELAIDIKLVLQKVDAKLCAYFDGALESFLWRRDGDTGCYVRNMFLDPVSYIHTIEDCEVRIGENTFFGCEVKKFQLDPRDGGVMNMGVSVTAYPNSEQVARLAKDVQEDVMVTIRAPLDLFADAGNKT